MKKNSGSILIEAILGLAIAITLITAIVTALISSLSSSSFSRNQSIASGYAQEGIELVRSIRDVDYSTLSGYQDGVYCFNPSYVLGNCPETINDSGSTFSRKIEISKTNPKCTSSIYVASIVTWKDAKCRSNDECHKVELNTCLINLDYVQLP